MPCACSWEGRIWPIWKVDQTSKLMLSHIVGARNNFFIQNHRPTIPLSCHQQKLIRNISQKKTTPFIKTTILWKWSKWATPKPKKLGQLYKLMCYHIVRARNKFFFTKSYTYYPSIMPPRKINSKHFSKKTKKFPKKSFLAFWTKFNFFFKVDALCFF